MDKKVLVLCTGNSCRSIIAEALINHEVEGVRAWSAGVAPSGRVNSNAKKVLEAHGVWDDRYHSKSVDEVADIDFDLVVTVCDHAKENCPLFPRPLPRIHEGFEDPDGKPYDAFEATYEAIRFRLLPRVAAILRGDVAKMRADEKICYCIGVTKGSILEAIGKGATTLGEIKAQTKACTGSDCKATNPLRRCCSKEIHKLIELTTGERKMMQKDVAKTKNGVKINFTGVVEKQQIVKMVENCATGQCECMSDETKQKITDMKVDGKDGAVTLELSGEVAKEEIEAALKKSKVLNKR